MNKSLLALFSFEVVDFANTSANLHLHENHNKNKRWQAMPLHFPDINGTSLCLSLGLCYRRYMIVVVVCLQNTLLRIEVGFFGHFLNIN